jgi:hypothetical protein
MNSWTKINVNDIKHRIHTKAFNEVTRILNNDDEYTKNMNIKR